MKIKFTLILISILFCSELYAKRFLYLHRDRLLLSGGLHGSVTNVSTEHNDNYFPGVGVSTHFGHQWTKWEFTLSSYAYIGEIRELDFHFSNEIISGEGHITSASFGPMVKYRTETYLFSKYNIYFGAGPIWSIETIKLESPPSGETEEEWEDNHKITYNSRGLILVLGIQDSTLLKSEHPYYFEIAYSYLRAYKISLVDITDRAKVETISREEVTQRVGGHTFMIAVGITIF